MSSHLQHLQAWVSPRPLTGSSTSLCQPRGQSSFVLSKSSEHSHGTLPGA